ncbi:Major cardiolipin synthase ClsA [compost metagenome]
MLWLTIALLIFIFQTATILILEFRQPAKAVAWLFILFCFPLIGFVVYYFVAQDYKKRKVLRNQGSRLFQQIKETLWRQTEVIHEIQHMSNPEFVHYERLFNMLSRLTESPITGCNRATVLTDGEETFASMLTAIEQAQDHIHIEFYIFRADTIGTTFQNLLIRKAKEGVKVRFIVDGLGSYHLPSSFAEVCRQAGIEFHYFLPPLLATLDKRINYRNHRKILIVDGRVGFVGGLNVGDDYLGQYPKMGYWRDTHTRIEGDAVYFLQNTFLSDWKLASGERIDDLGLFPPHECDGDEQVQIVASGPDLEWDAIQELCFGAIAVARRRVWLTTPYFIPDPSIYEALKTAAVSGVDVRIIIPYHSDSILVKLASLSYVGELLNAGVRFYQYRKGFMHAKILIVDDLFGSVGTANMDMRSLFYNFELTTLVFSAPFIQQLEQDFKRDLEHSSAIVSERFKERPRIQKTAEVLARMLSPLL